MTYQPSSTLVCKTVRDICTKQRQITDWKRGATLIWLVLLRLPNLTELALRFGNTIEEVGWVKPCLDLMSMDGKVF
jgi:hypothetical protein